MREIILNSDKLKSVEVDNATVNNRLKKNKGGITAYQKCECKVRETK